MSQTPPYLNLKRQGDMILAELVITPDVTETADCFAQIEIAKNHCLKRWEGVIMRVGSLRAGSTPYDMRFDVILHPDVLP